MHPEVVLNGQLAIHPMHLSGHPIGIVPEVQGRCEHQLEGLLRVLNVLGIVNRGGEDISIVTVLNCDLRGGKGGGEDGLEVDVVVESEL